MMFVSITQTGKLLRLRRYEGRVQALTHAGCYEPGGVTPVNLENYRQNGAPQDRLVPLSIPPRRSVGATYPA